VLLQCIVGLMSRYWLHHLRWRHIHQRQDDIRRNLGANRDALPGLGRSI
jgi:hypothetical protein